ncbi:uncharacterized protein ARMOST_16631 [Armillaria ostoyae]|uniref:Uncharacterized protein n=1 Tax=Armillaria ostoyae TaxID=47428 RepID=A0A284RWS3_ARMOS|nr:uncharacterized protein ARMOST_16631 [Armillaria ostoyae]
MYLHGQQNPVAALSFKSRTCFFGKWETIRLTLSPISTDRLQLVTCAKPEYGFPRKCFHLRESGESNTAGISQAIATESHSLE